MTEVGETHDMITPVVQNVKILTIFPMMEQRPPLYFFEKQMTDVIFDEWRRLTNSFTFVLEMLTGLQNNSCEWHGKHFLIRILTEKWRRNLNLDPILEECQYFSESDDGAFSFWRKGCPFFFTMSKDYWNLICWINNEKRTYKPGVEHFMTTYLGPRTNSHGLLYRGSLVK